MTKMRHAQMNKEIECASSRLSPCFIYSLHILHSVAREAIFVEYVFGAPSI